MGSLTWQEWRTLLAIALLSVVTYLDYYGVAIALPAIGLEFSTSGVELEWVMNGHLLAFAAPLIAMGRLTDIFGPRAMVIVGALVFGGGGALAGFSPNIDVLIAARAIQGLGDAMLAVAAYSLLTRGFEGARRSAGIGAFSAIGLCGGLVGPFVSGALTDALSWRWFFYLIAGMTAAGFLLAVLFADKVAAEDGDRKIDVGGFLSLSASLLLLIVGLQFVSTSGWFAPRVVGCIAASALCLLAFYHIEKRVASPLVDFALFRDPSFSGTCLILFLIYFPFGALMVYLAMYLQHILSFTALQTGVIYLALMLPSVLLSLFMGRVLQLAGARLTMTSGVTLITLGFVSFGFVHPATTGLGVIITGLVLVGAGRGLCATAPMAVGLSSIAKSKVGAASAVLQSMSMISIPIGIATFGAFFRAWQNNQLSHAFTVAGQSLDDQTKSDIFDLLAGSDAMKAKLAKVASDVALRVDLVVGDAFSHAFRNVMFLSIALLVAVPVCIFLMRHEDSVSCDHRTHKQ